MPRYEVQLYTPHPGQQLFHNCTARFIVMNCGRRFGKTISAANEMCKFACDHTQTLSWWVAPTYRQAKIAYRQMKKALAPLTSRSSDTELRIELINGAVIECRSADNPDNLRGEGVHMLVVEEAAMLPAKVWFEILSPMLADTNGRAVFISTPKGRNWFYTLFQAGLDPFRPEYASFTFPTSANPYVPADAIEQAKKDLPEDTFRQEFLAEFLEESAGVFRGIDACIYKPYVQEKPIAGHIYFLGWDVARYQDFSVATVIDGVTMRVVAWWRTNQVDYSFQINQVCELAHLYDAYILMDATGGGIAVLEMLQKRYPAAQGFTFTNTSKKEVIETLQLAFQHQAIQIPDIDVLIGEIRSFEYQFNPRTRNVMYSAPDGMHDDAVTSLGLAYYAASKPTIPLLGDNIIEESIEVPTIAQIEKYDPFQWANDHAAWENEE